MEVTKPSFPFKWGDGVMHEDRSLASCLPESVYPSLIANPPALRTETPGDRKQYRTGGKRRGKLR